MLKRNSIKASVIRVKQYSPLECYSAKKHYSYYQCAVIEMAGNSLTVDCDRNNRHLTRKSKEITIQFLSPKP